MERGRGRGNSKQDGPHQKQGDGLLEKGGGTVTQVLRQIDSVDIDRLEQVQGHAARPDASGDPVLDAHGQQVSHNDGDGGVGNHVPLAHAGHRLRTAVGGGPEAGHGVHDQALNQNGGDHVEPVGQRGLYPDFGDK